MDKRARRERIEQLLAVQEELDTLAELPLPERFRTLVEWAERHLSPAEQEWLYQQWQRALEFFMEEPSGRPAPVADLLSSKERGMKRVRAEVEVTRRTSIEFKVEDDADPEEIKATAFEAAELAEWDDDPPEVVSLEIIDPS